MDSNECETYPDLLQLIEEERLRHGKLLARLVSFKHGPPLPEADKEYIALLRKRTKASVLLLQGQNEADMLALNESYQRKKREREKKIAMVQQEIVIIKQMLGMLQNEVEKALEGHPRIQKEDMDELSEPDRLKKSYIVGKRTGKDLIDQEGKQLIAKGDLITMELIEKAEQSNLLVELILHMRKSEESET